MARNRCKLVDGYLVFEQEGDEVILPLSAERVAKIEAMGFAERDELMVHLAIAVECLYDAACGIVDVPQLGSITASSLSSAIDFLRQMLLSPPEPSGLIIIDTESDQAPTEAEPQRPTRTHYSSSLPLL